MARKLLSIVVLGCCTFSPALGQTREGPREGPPAEAPKKELPPAPLPVHEDCAPPERTLCFPKTYLVEERRETVVPRLAILPEVVGRLQGIEVRFKEEKRTVSVTKLVPREVEKTFCTTKMVPVTTTDPCTGHCCTHYEAVPDVKTVKVTVYDVVPETQEVIVKVPEVVPGQEFNVVRLVPYRTMEAAIEMRLKAVTVPNEVKVPLPPPPCPEPCPHP